MMRDPAAWCAVAPRAPVPSGSLALSDVSCRAPAHWWARALGRGAGRRWSRWVRFWRKTDRRDAVAAGRQVEPVAGHRGGDVDARLGDRPDTVNERLRDRTRTPRPAPPTAPYPISVTRHPFTVGVNVPK